MPYLLVITGIPRALRMVILSQATHTPDLALWPVIISDYLTPENLLLACFFLQEQ